MKAFLAACVAVGAVAVATVPHADAQVVLRFGPRPHHYWHEGYWGDRHGYWEHRRWAEHREWCYYHRCR